MHSWQSLVVYLIDYLIDRVFRGSISPKKDVWFYFKLRKKGIRSTRLRANSPTPTGQGTWTNYWSVFKSEFPINKCGMKLIWGSAILKWLYLYDLLSMSSERNLYYFKETQPSPFQEGTKDHRANAVRGWWSLLSFERRQFIRMAHSVQRESISYATTKRCCKDLTFCWTLSGTE